MARPFAVEARHVSNDNNAGDILQNVTAAAVQAVMAQIGEVNQHALVGVDANMAAATAAATAQRRNGADRGTTSTSAR